MQALARERDAEDVAASRDLARPEHAAHGDHASIRRRCAGRRSTTTSCSRRSDGIADETGRLRRRIDNLLSMARLEAGKAKPRREPTPPADLFHAVRENLPLVFRVAAGHDPRRRRLPRRQRRSVARAGDPRQSDRERAPRLAAGRAAGAGRARASARSRRRSASKCSIAGRDCRPASRMRKAIFSQARRATSRNAVSDWRSRAVSPSRMAGASASRRGRAAARSRASTFSPRRCPTPLLQRPRMTIAPVILVVDDDPAIRESLERELRRERLHDRQRQRRARRRARVREPCARSRSDRSLHAALGRLRADLRDPREGRGRRSSCSRSAAMTPTRFARSTSAPTTS